MKWALGTKVLEIIFPSSYNTTHHLHRKIRVLRVPVAMLLLVAIATLGFTVEPGFGNDPGGVPDTRLGEQLKKIMINRRAARFELGLSRRGKPVEAYYFPGYSDVNALVIGGVHGSELSSIEVARSLIQRLSQGNSIFYNVIVIPCLFPDNAERALQRYVDIGSWRNIGRYSFTGAADPNRQMPTPGTTVDEDDHTDHAGRRIETENLLLLQLINEFKPERIASVHGIHNTAHAGFFADPRTDEKGIALGYESDSILAVNMAAYVHRRGGMVPGNRMEDSPNALYYKDPRPVPAGQYQPRNYTGSPLPGKKGSGISLGTWGTTAVRDTINPDLSREAMRVITIEFPGNKRPRDYASATQKESTRRLVNHYADAIRQVFLN